MGSVRFAHEGDIAAALPTSWITSPAPSRSTPYGATARMTEAMTYSTSFVAILISTDVLGVRTAYRGSVPTTAEAGYPNGNWTAENTNVLFTSATITVYQSGLQVQTKTFLL